MAGKQATRSGRKSRPLGRVVGGVYVVNPRKRSEPGARPRRRRRQPDFRRTWARPLEQIQPLVGGLTNTVFPTHHYAPGDPRLRSRFLGTIIDGACGWIADTGSMVPLVGPVTGPILRTAAHTVRTLEDMINKLTGIAGLHLFLVCLLTCACPAAGVTNCCNQNQVKACWQSVCLHAPNCVICEDMNGNITCWIPTSHITSSREGGDWFDHRFAAHVDAFATAVALCNELELSEFCGTAFIAAVSIVTNTYVHVNITTDADCYLYVPTGIDPGFLGFVGWALDQATLVSYIVGFISRIPAALIALVHAGHFGFWASMCWMLFRGKYVHVLVFLGLYVETVSGLYARIPWQSGFAGAATDLAAVMPQVKQYVRTWSQMAEAIYNNSCNPMEVPPQCPEIFDVHIWNSATYCWSIAGGRMYTPPKDSYLGEVAKRFNLSGWSPVAIGALTESYAGVTFRHHQLYRPNGCVVARKEGEGTTARVVHHCCSNRHVNPKCGTCASDCSWLSPDMTYENCGRVPWISTTKRGNGTGVAWLNLIPRPKPNLKFFSHFFAGNAKWDYAIDKDLLDNLTRDEWARLPFTPPSYRGSWMYVPKGMYSTLRDLSTGLISKDMGYPDYQLRYSASGAVHLGGLNHHLLVVVVLCLLGARWSLSFYVVMLLVSGVEGSVGHWVAGYAASHWPTWWFRLLVFILVSRWPGTTPMLAHNPLAMVCTYILCDLSLADTLLALATGLITCFFCLTATDVMSRTRLAFQYLRVRLALWMDTADARVILAATVVAPTAVRWTCIFLFVTYVLLGIAIVVSTALASYSPVYYLLVKLATAHNRAASWLRGWVLTVLGDRGKFLYKHLGTIIMDELPSTDPYLPITITGAIVRDPGHNLACGDVIKNRPVQARLGDLVYAGAGSIPRGWKAAAPFSLKLMSTRNELRSFAVSLTGKDTTEKKGCIAVLGSSMKACMGFGLGGSLYTVHHGVNDRHIATKHGRRPHLMAKREEDVVRYDLPHGMNCLEPCTCDRADGWLATRFGNLIPVTRVSKEWVNTAPLMLRECKGSSGAPVICACRGVKGMLRAARASRGVVKSVLLIDVEKLTSDPLRPAKPVEMDNPPEVPKDKKEVRHLIAPTGSGKTTKLPMHYYSKGYRVLVLNPSVATTLSMFEYMKTKYGISPNIHTGENTHKHGSRLTYSTYGRFLAEQMPLDKVDVIICDECHATDPTTVLGIGSTLSAFEKSDSKLLILATATPPGSQITAHPNITTTVLKDDGDIPFHGKKINSALLKKGRHLIFEATKKHCVSLCNDLRNLGINAVYYYRGEPIDKIPTSGDVVVVATDALMTGYTGNFDSVYDCCLSVYSHVEIDMNPTIKTAILTRPADSVTRMQRRGRTGRGAPGRYYPVADACAPTGMLPDASIWEAFDSGIVYFGQTTAEIAEHLDAYKQEGITPAVRVNLQEVQTFYELLGYVSPSIIARMKNRTDSLVYLHAAQYELAKQVGAGPPNDDEVWQGLSGSAPFPLLYHLGDYDLEKCKTGDLAHRLASAFEEFQASITLVGLGAAAAAVYIAVDMLGCVTVRTTYDLTSDSTATFVSRPDDNELGEIEECAVGLESIGDAANAASSWLGDRLMKLGGTLGGTPTTQHAIAVVLPHLLSAIQYFAGLSIMTSAPVLGACLGFIGTAMSHLPLATNLFLSTLGGALATKLTTQRGAAGFALAGICGSLVGAGGLFNALCSSLSVYSSGVSTCLVVLKLLEGVNPSFEEWASLGLAVLSPGGGLMGLAVGLLIGYLTKSENQIWLNRLLSMLNRGTTCDDYFVPATTMRKKVIEWMEIICPWHAFCALATWANCPDEELCSVSGRLETLRAWCGRMLRAIVEFARGITHKCLAIEGLPTSCSKAYRGAWIGSGTVRSTCGCGREGVWMIEDGKPKRISVSKWCCAYWSGGVPIGSSFMGCARPAPVNWETISVNNGYNSYATYHKDQKGDVWLMAVSHPDQLVEGTCPDIAAAVAVDGAQVKSLGGEGWREARAYRARIRTGKGIVALTLPVNLTSLITIDIPNKQTVSPIIVPEMVRREVQLGERATGLESTRRDSESEDSIAEYERLRKERKEKMRRNSLPLGVTKTETLIKEDIKQGCTKVAVTEAKEIMVELRGQATGKLDKLNRPPSPGYTPSEVGATGLNPSAKPFTPSSSSTGPDLTKPMSPLEAVRYAADVAARKASAYVNQVTEWRRGDGRKVDDAVEMEPLNPPETQKKEEEKPKPPEKPPRPNKPTQDPKITFGAPEYSPVPDDSDSGSWETASSSDVALGAQPKRRKVKPQPKPKPKAPGKTPLSKFEPEVIPLKPKLAKLKPSVASLPDDDRVSLSMQSSSWTSCSSVEEEECSLSYTWAVKSFAYRASKRVFSAVRNYSDGLMRDRNLAYATDTSSIEERVRKVTIVRNPVSCDELHQTFIGMLAKAKTLALPEWSLEEALAHLKNNSAKSGVTGAKPEDIKRGATQVVMGVYDSLSTKIVAPWNHVNIMPKSEVFVETPGKKTHKPARIIAYPHLEMRIAEKMVLGNIAPAVAKHLMGDQYGFLYSPKERVSLLVRRWKGKDRPMGFSCDTVCFDSTITPEDMDRECQLFSAAAGSAATRVRIAVLHRDLYAGGPMYMQGRYMGERHCRASGVFTTSSGNTITCFLKVSTAARMAGLRSPWFLICGDDCICICESDGIHMDKARIEHFCQAMLRMGARQGEVPRACYSLEEITSCSTNVTASTTKLGVYHYLSRDPRIALARCSAEGPRYNPLGSWAGNLIMYYPTVWASRVLAVQFMRHALSQDDFSTIVIDWYGNEFPVPTHLLPHIIEAYHGKACWQVDNFTTRELERTTQALSDLTMKPLRYWKREARTVLARCRRRGGVIRRLGNALLWWVHKNPVTLDQQEVNRMSKFRMYDVYAPPPPWLTPQRNIVGKVCLVASAALGMIASLLLVI